MSINDWVPRLAKKEAKENETICRDCKGVGWEETDFGFLQCPICSGHGVMGTNAPRIHKTLIGPRR